MQEKEFEVLFRDNYFRLYYYALDWVENEEAAKDIVSDLFGDLWEHYEAWQPRDHAAYLNRAIRNRCLNYLKHQAVEQRSLQLYLEEKQAAMAADAGEQEELMKRVKAVMDGLSPKTRFIVEQCYIEGRKYSELATQLETTAGMVHKHISKALAKFRRVLGEKNSAARGTETESELSI